MSMVPPARSTRGGAEDSIIIADFQLPIADLFETKNARKVTIPIHHLQIGNRQLEIGAIVSVGVALRFLWLTASLLLEGDVFLDLLFEILELFSCRMFELM